MLPNFHSAFTYNILIILISVLLGIFTNYAFPFIFAIILVILLPSCSKKCIKPVKKPKVGYIVTGIDSVGVEYKSQVDSMKKVSELIDYFQDQGYDIEIDFIDL